MGANRLEAFDTKVVKRNEIHEADYNPRTISDAAAKKIKRFMTKHGSWSPLVVNKQTMILVSGHQRIAAMDAILKKPDYKLTVAIVDVDEETEVKGNVFFNNPSAQGEWDTLKLEGLHEIFPEIDYMKDFGFDESEVSIMFDTLSKEIEQERVEKEKPPQFTADQFREQKKEMREKAKAQNAETGSYHIDENDYAVTVVFPNNYEKQKFMKKIKKSGDEKFLKSNIFMDIFTHKFELSDVSNGKKET